MGAGLSWSAAPFSSFPASAVLPPLPSVSVPSVLWFDADGDMDADADHIVSSMRTMPKEFVVASPDRVLHASRAAVEWESPATKSPATKSNATKSNATMGDDTAEDRRNKRRRNELFPVVDPMVMMDDVGELGDSSDADMFSLGLFDGKGIDGKLFDGK